MLASPVNSLHRIIFTLVFLTVMVVANWLAGTFLGALPPQALAAWGISHHSILDGEVFRLVTGTFLSHDAGMFARQFLFVATVIGFYEWSEGTWRTFLIFFLIDILGTFLVFFAVLPILVGLPFAAGEAELFSHDVGMSAGGFGLIGALIAKQRLGAILLGLAVVPIAAKIWIYFEAIADTAHLLCLFLGFALQSVLNLRGVTSERAEL
jgi:hypothetical protein